MLLERNTFSTSVDSGGRFCAITRIRISFELTKSNIYDCILFIRQLISLKKKKLFIYLFFLFTFFLIGQRRQWNLINKRLTWEFPVVYHQPSQLLSLIAVQASFWLLLKLCLLAKPLQPCTNQQTVRQVIWVILHKNMWIESIDIQRNITYFEFSGMIVDKDGLNIRSRSVSINVFGPAYQTKHNDIYFLLWERQVLNTTNLSLKIV